MTYFARIRPWGKKPTDESMIIGTWSGKDTLEEFWPYVQKNLEMYMPHFAIPSQPREIEALPILLRHVGPNNPAYPVLPGVDTGVVWAWRFVAEKHYIEEKDRLYVLEMWRSDHDVALPEKYWEDHEPSSFSPTVV